MGLIKGHDSGLIEPNGNLTRAQLASIMARISTYFKNYKIKFNKTIDKRYNTVIINVTVLYFTFAEG